MNRYFLYGGGFYFPFAARIHDGSRGIGILFVQPDDAVMPTG